MTASYVGSPDYIHRPIAKPEKALQGEAYSAAVRRLREAHREELDKYIDEEFAVRGLDRRRRRTRAEVEEAKRQEKRRRDRAVVDRILERTPDLMEDDEDEEEEPPQGG